MLKYPERARARKHDVGVGQRHVERAAGAPEGAVERGSRPQGASREETTHHDRDQQGLPRQRVGVVAAPRAERPGDRGGHAAPHAPADMVCMSMISGKTKDTPARASAPSQPTKTASMALTTAWMTITTTVGAASRRSVAAIGSSRRRRVLVASRPVSRHPHRMPRPARPGRIGASDRAGPRSCQGLPA
jgi:hypothetical protein